MRDPFEQGGRGIFSLVSMQVLACTCSRPLRLSNKMKKKKRAGCGTGTVEEKAVIMLWETPTHTLINHDCPEVVSTRRFIFLTHTSILSHKTSIHPSVYLGGPVMPAFTSHPQ